MSSKVGNSLKSAMQQAKQQALVQTEVAYVLPERIRTRPSQPRRYFDPVAQESLEASIEAKGVLQPLVVRPTENGYFELIAGERRLRAARSLGLTEVPAVVRSLSDLEAVEVALAENLQREDLNPVEETEGILELLALRLGESVEDAVSLLYAMQNAAKGKTTHNVMGSQQETVEAVFKSVAAMTWLSFVSNRLPLLKLPEDVLTELREGRLDYTKAVLVARVKDPEKRGQLLQRAIKEGLSISELREAIKTFHSSASSTDDLQTRVSKLPRLFKGSQALSDARRRKRAEKLLQELEALLAEVP